MIEKQYRSSQTPYRYIPIGERFIWKGVEYIVVPRGNLEKPRDACIGCDFARCNCPDNIACSRFDRADDRNVWFIRKTLTVK